MKRHVRLLVPVLLIAALAAAQEPPAATPAGELGLAKGDVLATPLPPPVEPENSDPGERPRLPRAWEGEPPRVPHAIADFLPITLEDNLCVDCHAIAEAEEGDPTPLPASHYTDLRRSPDEVGGTVAGARWVCTGCHVPPTGAEPLVGNGFHLPEPAAPAAAAGR